LRLSPRLAVPPGGGVWGSQEDRCSLGAVAQKSFSRTGEMLSFSSGLHSPLGPIDTVHQLIKNHHTHRILGHPFMPFIAIIFSSMVRPWMITTNKLITILHTMIAVCRRRLPHCHHLFAKHNSCSSCILRDLVDSHYSES